MRCDGFIAIVVCESGDYSDTSLFMHEKRWYAHFREKLELGFKGLTHPSLVCHRRERYGDRCHEHIQNACIDQKIGDMDRSSSPFLTLLKLIEKRKFVKTSSILGLKLLTRSVII
jgi:hypothetical protein